MNRMVVMSNGSVYVRREHDGRAVWARQRPRYRSANPFHVPSPAGLLVVAALLGAVEVAGWAWWAAKLAGRLGWTLAGCAVRLARGVAAQPWRVTRKMWRDRCYPAVALWVAGWVTLVVNVAGPLVFR